MDEKKIPFWQKILMALLVLAILALSLIPKIRFYLGE